LKTKNSPWNIMKFTPKSLLKLFACTVVTLGTASLVYAAGSANLDVSGTWTWTGGGFGGGAFAGRGGAGGGGAGGGAGARAGGFGFAGGTNVLVLKADVATGVVTGTLTTPAFGGGRGGRRGGGAGGGADAGTPPPAPTPVEISNGKITGNVLTFEVTRPARGGGADTTTSYKATVSADLKSITGTTVTPAPFTATKQ
jgi:hypothetical protein